MTDPRYFASSGGGGRILAGKMQLDEFPKSLVVRVAQSLSL